MIRTGELSARRLLDAAARITLLGGTAPHEGRAAELRARFEARTGAFVSEDPWFEERSRAFWCDAVTRERFGRDVEAELTAADRAALAPLERAHRGLFRVAGPLGAGHGTRDGDGATVFVDVWSGAEFAVAAIDDATWAELEAGADQLFDARIAGGPGDDPAAAPAAALLPGAVFHPRSATEAIEGILAAARSRSLGTHETLDALLRMERTLRALSRVKTSYAYRADSLSLQPPAPGGAAPGGGGRAGRAKRA